MDYKEIWLKRTIKKTTLQPLPSQEAIIYLIPQKAMKRTIIYTKLYIKPDKSRHILAKYSYIIQFPELLYLVLFTPDKNTYYVESRFYPLIIERKPTSFNDPVVQMLNLPNVSNQGACLGNYSPDPLKFPLIDLAKSKIDTFWQSSFNDEMYRDYDWTTHLSNISKRASPLDRGSKKTLFEVLLYAGYEFDNCSHYYLWK